MQGLWFFRIWRFYSGKVAVGSGLFLNKMNIIVTGFFQYLGHSSYRSSMQRSKYNYKIFSSFQFELPQLDGFIKKGLIYVFINPINQIFFGIKFYIRKLNLIDLFDDLSVLWGNYLSSIFPVYLVSIILWGIVGCSQYNSAMGLKVFNSEGKLGSRSQISEDKYLNIVG